MNPELNKKKITFVNDARAETYQLNKNVNFHKKTEINRQVIGSVNLPEQFCIAERPNELSKLDSLPEFFCIKGDQGEQAKEVLLIKKLETKYKDYMHNNLYTRAQLGLKVRELMHNCGKVIIEEWLGAPKIPIDYKIEIVRGEILFIGVIDRNGGGNRTNLYSAEWKRIPFLDVFTQAVPYIIIDMSDADAAKLLPPPELRPELIQAALTVYNIFKRPTLLRVDLYAVNGKVYFGECTVRCGLLKNCNMQKPFLEKLLGPSA